jgi:hypothetical protein
MNTTKDISDFVSKNKDSLGKIVSKLLKRNPEYSKKELESFLDTELYLSKLTLRGLYIAVLNRILDEKGIKYIDGKEFRPERIVENKVYMDKDRESIVSILMKVLSHASLTQEEILVLCLMGGLDAPEKLKEPYHSMINSMNMSYYAQGLNCKEIAKLLKTPVRDILMTKKIAINKVKEHCGV